MSSDSADAKKISLKKKQVKKNRSNDSTSNDSTSNDTRSNDTGSSDSTSNDTGSNDSTSNDSTSNDTTSNDSESNQIVPFSIISNETNEIKYIYHISDIHIRNEKRHEEYSEVFKRLYEFISNDMKKNSKSNSEDSKINSLIVITGDILHEKTEMRPESINMVASLFTNLANILPTFVIPGNHDCNLSNLDRMDALSPIVNHAARANFYYLKTSGIYMYNNIFFAHCGLLDNLFIRSKDITKSHLTNTKCAHDSIHKVALYHGPVHGAETDVGARMNHKELTVDKFVGYDYIMLGDIHRFQYLGTDTKNTIPSQKITNIAYAGSLIQQNYGETINNHGVLKWYLGSGTSVHHTIKNNYGFYNIYLKNGKSSIDLDTDNIPRKPSFKILVESTTNQEYKEFIDSLYAKYDVVEIIKKTIFASGEKRHGAHNLKNLIRENLKEGTRVQKGGKAIELNTEDNGSHKHSYDGSQKNLSNDTHTHHKHEHEYEHEHEKDSESGSDERINNPEIQEKIIRNYLEKKNFGEKLIEGLLKLHNDTYKKVSSCDKDTTGGSKPYLQRWQIQKLEFYNMLSYGGSESHKNTVDFTKFPSGELIGILAPNRYGKSSLLDILLFCIFDCFPRGERKDIMNKDSNQMHCSLIFSIGSTKYQIIRNGTRGKESSVKISVDFYTWDRHKKLIKLNGLSVKETNQKIVDLLGTYKDYLATCFSLQNQGSSFLEMTHGARKDYLSELLRLNIFELCFAHVKSYQVELTGRMKTVEGSLGNWVLAEMHQNEINRERELKEVENKVSSIIEAQDFLTQFLETQEERTISTFDELSSYKLNTLADYEYLKGKLTRDKNFLEEKQREISKNNSSVTLESALASTSSVVAPDFVLSLRQVEKELNQAEDMYSEWKNKSDEEIKLLREEIEALQSQKIYVPQSIKQINEKTTEEEIARINEAIDKSKERITKGRDSIKKLSRTNPRLRIETNTEFLNDTIEKIEHQIKLRKKAIVAHDSDKLKQKQYLIPTSEINENELKSSIEDELKSIIELLDLIEKYNQIPKLITLDNKIYFEYIDQIICQIKNKFDSCVSDDMVNGTSLSDFYSMLQLLTKRSELLLSTNNELLNQLSKEINQKIVQMKTSQLNQDSMSHNLIQELDNQFILEEINELSFAHEFYQSIMENLEDIALAEKKLESQQERFVLVGDKLNLVKQYLGADESNERINVEIGKVRERIVHCGNGAKPYLEQINSTKAQIKKIKQQEQEYQLDKEVQEETMNRLKTLSKHLHLIDLQSLFYLDKQTNTNDLKLFKKTLDEIRFEHNKYEKQIYQLNAELTILRKDIAKYIKIQKEKDKIGEELNLYTSYLNLMHRNGLPYEILKGYLPYIEMEINQILESMVEFSIQFIFYDDEEQSQKDLKGKGLKANSGCIEIVIYYPDKKPYSVQLSSGFERFIIGLAVRIALCQISMIAKPNFIVIDEGWSCFDREHLENVGNVLNYLKTQYDHVLIISHLEQLKGQVSDYTIKIGKKNGFSYLMNGEKEKEKVSQKQSKKISTKKLREENVV